MDNEIIRDTLLLVLEKPPTIKEISGWISEQKVMVSEWAICVHLRASDNIIKVPEKPDCLKGYK